ncbi:MAG: toprim domain-containing protein [Candidatus Bathyarchaeia archaeon]
MPVDEVRLEKFSKLIERVASQCGSGIPILVEGRNDKFTLRQLGVHGKIFEIKSHGENLFAFLDRLLNEIKALILLTDFDEEGDELAFSIIDELSRRGIKVNDRIRKGLKKMVSSEIRSIEDLKGFFERLKSKTINRRPYALSKQ